MDYLQISKLTNYLYTFTCLNDEFTLCAEDGLSDPTLYWIALSQLLCFGDDLDSLPETIHFNQYFNSTLPTALKVGPALHQYSALSSTEVSFYTKCAVSCLAKLLRQSKVLDSTSQLTLKSISALPTIYITTMSSHLRQRQLLQLFTPFISALIYHVSFIIFCEKEAT